MSNTVAIVESYLAAKADLDHAENALKVIKDEVIAVVGGYGFLEGQTADLDVAVQARKSISEKLLLQFLTQEQIDACRIEGAAYPVVRIKAKKPHKASKAA
jgi:hypothetical protein